MERTCSIEGCEAPHYGRDFCHRHYQRVRRTGSFRRPSAAERFWSQVDKSGDCWLWTGYVDSGGYGRFYVAGRRVPAHRWAYESIIGPIPEGMQLDHLCRVRRCVRPDCLEPVTQRVNVLRGVGLTATNATKTHCPQGHPYAGDNLIQERGSRLCRICRQERERRRRGRKDPNMHVSDEMLVDQTFTARPATEHEGGNFVVTGPAAGVVTAIASDDPAFADRVAESFGIGWAEMDADERHALLHNTAGCGRCMGNDLSAR